MIVRYVNCKLGCHKIRWVYNTYSFTIYFLEGRQTSLQQPPRGTNLPTFQNTRTGVIDPVFQSRTRLCSSLSTCGVLPYRLSPPISGDTEQTTLAPRRDLIKKSQQLKIPPENSISGPNAPGAAAAAPCYAAPCRPSPQPQFAQSCGRSHNIHSGASICSSVFPPQNSVPTLNVLDVLAGAKFSVDLA